MRAKHIAVLLLLVLLCGLVGYRSSHATLERGVTPARDMRMKAYAFYLAGKHRDAERAYQAAYGLAVELGDKEEAFRCLSGVGGARFARFEYQGAMEAYLEARRLA